MDRDSYDIFDPWDRSEEDEFEPSQPVSAPAPIAAPEPVPQPSPPPPPPPPRPTVYYLPPNLLDQLPCIPSRGRRLSEHAQACRLFRALFQQKHLTESQLKLLAASTGLTFREAERMYKRCYYRDEFRQRTQTQFPFNIL